MDLKPGTFVVFEGMDKTGKSTQRQAMEGLFPDVHYTHQPSGGTVVGQLVYQIEEEMHGSINPVARQFLHLAAHAEHYHREIIPTLSDRAVIMDRCWWSTVAYGWWGGGIKYLCELADFTFMAQLPTQGIQPNVVFLFLEPFEKDHHNTEEVRNGYLCLASEFPGTVHVPVLSVEETTNFIVGELKRLGLVVE